MSDFLDSDYEVPQKAGNYMRFDEDENKFRILDKHSYRLPYSFDKNYICYMIYLVSSLSIGGSNGGNKNRAMDIGLAEKTSLFKEDSWSIEKLRRPFIFWLTSLTLAEKEKINK